MTVQTIPFSFSDLYDNAKQIFRDAGFDTSEGSNTSQLSAVMAYMVAALNTNTAFNINETLLPYATKRKNILQDARVLGYEPVHKVSYVYKAKLSLDRKLAGYGKAVIDKYSYVESNGHKYYVWDSDVTVDLGSVVVSGIELNPDFISSSKTELVKVSIENISESGTYWYLVNGTATRLNGSALKTACDDALAVFDDMSTKTFNVTEGSELIRSSESNDLIRTLPIQISDSQVVFSQYVDIPYTDVENDGIHCYVSYYDNSGEKQERVPFTRSDDYFFEDTDDGQNHFLRLDDIEMSTPRVYFQYAGAGKALPEDSQIFFDILISSGSDGEAEETGTLKSETLSQFGTTNGWLEDIMAGGTLTLEPVKTGTDDETNERVRVNAPRVYNSAHRLITCLDFQSACNKDTNVRDSAVWGGETEFPKAPGHIWFSFCRNISDDGFENFTRKERELYLKDTEVLSVFESLSSRCVPSLSFHHRNPLYLLFDYTIKILKYNTRQGKTVHETLFDVLDNCFRGKDLALENFGVEYFHSNMVKRLDYTISDLSGFNTELQTRIVLNEQTLCTENWLPDYKDIYVPLCVPFEKYFNAAGYLDTTKLPNIDTDDFVKVKYTNKNLNLTLLKGDIFTDWSYINTDQEIRRRLRKGNDVNTKMFMAPVKIRMRYSYRLKSVPEVFKLGFMLAPDNTRDTSFGNMQVLVFKETDGEYSPDAGLSDNYHLIDSVYSDKEIDSLEQYVRDHPEKQYVSDSRRSFSDSFGYSNDKRTELRVRNAAIFSVGDVVEIRFERTCGYYYLFNNYEKNILIHLFVNNNDVVRTAAEGLSDTEDYSVLSEVKPSWKIHEAEILDDLMYNDITGTCPRSYLYTVDRRYLTCIEPTGTELETEPHYFAYNENGISSVSSQIRDLVMEGKTFDDPEVQTLLRRVPDTDRREEGTQNGHYLTTEGYLLTDEDSTTYTGPKIREYNEAMYLYSPLSRQMFRENVYLNLKYDSLNFKVRNNVIPRLNSVKFIDATVQYEES